MATRVVEWKKPYTWGKAIEIDENKVISLRLRDENNLIIWDEGDNEIYVDLQLPDELQPTDAFPVWVTTGRVIVDNGWDLAWTIICAKTTSGDSIKLLYADNWTLWIDNGTWIFKQIYLKWDVDTIIQALQNQIDVLMGLWKFLSIWNCSTWEPESFPLNIPYQYSTWDWYLVWVVDNTVNYKPDWSSFTGVASTVVETDAPEINDVYIYDWTTWMRQANSWIWGWTTFAQIIGLPTDNTNLAAALNAKQDTLTAGTNISIDTNTNTISANDTTYTAWTWIGITGTTISNNWVTSFNWNTWAITYTAPVTSVNWNTWAVTVAEVPSGWTDGQVLTQTSGWTPVWANATGGIENVTTWTTTTVTGIWAGTEAEYALITPDANTIYYVF